MSVLNADKEPDITTFYDIEIELPSWPTEEGWELYQDWLDGHHETLATIRRGAAKKGMGYLLSGGIAEEDKELWPDQYGSQQPEPEHDGFVMNVLMPQLSHHRAMARLLSYDAKLAAHEGDSSRCKEDLTAMFSLAEHVREHPVLISDLVSMSILNMTLSTMSEIFSHEPFLFDASSLAHLKTQLHQASTEIRFVGERYFMLDLLQRTYTDDGNGNGSIVPMEAAQKIAYMNTISETQMENQIKKTLKTSGTTGNCGFHLKVVVSFDWFA